MILRDVNAQPSASRLTRSLLNALHTVAAVAAAATLAACGGTSSPTADEIVTATTDLQDGDQLTLGQTVLDLPLVAGPLTGRGTRDLPQFSTAGVYSIKLRCLGEGSAAVSIAAEQQELRPCDNGELGVGGGGVDGDNELTGEPGTVAARVVASDDLYWVAAVFSCQQTTELADC